MALIKTWVHSMNVAPLDESTTQQLGRSFWIQLKEFLVNIAGWTVVSSSDKLTVNSSDLWGTTFTKLVPASSALARSWILLKSPIGMIAGPNGSYLGEQSRTYLCIDLASTTASYAQCSIKYHRELPTGGTVSSTPTSASSITVANSNTNFMSSSILGGVKFHFSAVTLGEGTPAKGAGAFYALISNPTTSEINTFLSVLPITDVSTDSVLGDYAYATGCIMSYNAVLASLFTTTLFDNVKGWCHDGTAVTSLYGMYYKGTPGTLGVNVNAKGDYSGKIASSDIILWNNTTGKAGMVGKIADFAITDNYGLFNFITDDAVAPLHCFLSPNIWVPTTSPITQ